METAGLGQSRVQDSVADDWGVGGCCCKGAKECGSQCRQQLKRIENIKGWRDWTWVKAPAYLGSDPGNYVSGTQRTTKIISEHRSRRTH